MVKVCEVVDCFNTSKNCDRTFFTFPKGNKKQDMFKAWVQFSENPRLRHRDRVFGFMCDNHFAPNAFSNSLKTKLTFYAVPTLNPPAVTPATNVRVSPHLSPVASHSPPSPSPSSSDLININDEPITSIQRKLDSSLTSDCHKSLTLSSIHMTRISEVTPRKRFLYDCAKKKEKELERLQKQYKEMALQFQDLIHGTSGDLLIDKLHQSLPKVPAVFLSSILRSSKIKTKDRRWTVQEKTLALFVYKRRPRCYTFLRSVMALPSKRTLSLFLNKIPFQTGINDQVFASLSSAAGKMSETDKICSLLFDEILLKEHFQYNRSADCIDGFEDHGHLGKTGTVASYALVFMVRGLFRKWKQPVAYYFINKGTSSDILSQLIGLVLDACYKAGLCVVATVCDMSTANVKAITCMGSTKTNPFFNHKGHTIYTILDPPHLLKSTRNMLLKHNVRCRVAAGNMNFEADAQWNDIVTVFHQDKGIAVRALYKLTNEHMEPKGSQKLKVEFAANVLSHTVAARINVFVNHGKLEKRAMATALFVKFVNDLFDSFNGSSYCCEDTPLKNVLIKGGAHIRFWQEALKTVDEWKFINNSGNEKPAVIRPPVQDGWLVSIKAVLGLWNALQIRKDVKYKYLCVRNLNQDPLENFFESIRSQCGFNHIPTVGQFVSAFKSCIVNGLRRRFFVTGGNCEFDDADLLSNLHMFLEADTDSQVVEQTTAFSVDDPGHGTFNKRAIPSSTAMMSIAYASRFIVKKMLANIKCDYCRAGLFCDGSEEYLNAGIFFNEYTEEEQNVRYPTEKVTETVSLCANLIDEVLAEQAHKNRLSRIIIQHIKKKISFDWLRLCCPSHFQQVSDKLINHIVNLYIPYWCAQKNREQQ